MIDFSAINTRRDFCISSREKEVSFANQLFTQLLQLIIYLPLYFNCCFCVSEQRGKVLANQIIMDRVKPVHDFHNAISSGQITAAVAGKMCKRHLLLLFKAIRIFYVFYRDGLFF